MSQEKGKERQHNWETRTLRESEGHEIEREREIVDFSYPTVLQPIGILVSCYHLVVVQI